MTKAPGKARKSEASASQNVAYEDCIVSFTDVLGFRHLLKNREAADVMDVLNQMQLFRQSVDDGKPVKVKEARLTSRPFAFAMSDAIVRVRPYDTQHRDGALVWELIDLVHAQIELVNRGVLVRGGMTVGKAYIGLKGQGPVFGPGLARAYEIETDEAVYPRIVVDDALLEAHRTDKRLWMSGNSYADEERAIDGLLATGDDGIRYIDYLAQLGEFDSPAHYLLFLERHAALIRRGREETKADRRTARKFEWLARYHNAQVFLQKETVLGSTDRRQSFLEEFDVDAEDFYGAVEV